MEEKTFKGSCKPVPWKEDEFGVKQIIKSAQVIFKPSKDGVGQYYVRHFDSFKDKIQDFPIKIDKQNPEDVCIDIPQNTSGDE